MEGEGGGDLELGCGEWIGDGDYGVGGAGGGVVRAKGRC